MILPAGEDDLNRITNTTRVIAVDTPNQEGIDSIWVSTELR